jgi:hypothetical protein
MAPPGLNESGKSWYPFYMSSKSYDNQKPNIFYAWQSRIIVEYIQRSLLYTNFNPFPATGTNEPNR